MLITHRKDTQIMKMFIVLKDNYFFTTRVREQEEIEGLDLQLHGERVYHND